ncbi:MAG: DUF2961 domain-containing protein [Sandaracinaceae bacterium]
MRRALAVLALACLAGCASCGTERSDCAPSDTAYDVTLGTLLHEMVDHDALAYAPAHPFVAAMESSYDRRSVSPDQPATWFANQDAGQFVRVDTIDGRTENVMLDVEGPGALTRLWTATPRGTLRVYLDGATQPTIEADFADLVSGDVDPFRAPFAYRVSNADVANCSHANPEGSGNVYFPIPFATRALVTVDDATVYFQLSYRRYEAGTRVQPYSACALEGARDAIDEASAALETPPAPTGRTERATLTPDADGDAIGVEGGGVIRRVEVTLPDAGDDALRGTVVELRFDGVLTARAPILELFGGGGPTLGDVTSGLARTSGRVLTFDAPMPFRERAEIRLRSAGSNAGAFPIALTVGEHGFDGARYLHARWMPYRVVDTSAPSEHTELQAIGRGSYLGNVLGVTNSSRAWWGEGDERMYVDGEAFPSFFGTGTEDYYGYAWCAAVEFARPFHGQTRVQGPETYGRSSLFRWHVLDRIEFARSFRFDLETTHWKTYARVGYEALHLFYAEPSAPPEPDAFDAAVYTIPEIAAHDPAAADPDDIPHHWE